MCVRVCVCCASLAGAWLQYWTLFASKHISAPMLLQYYAEHASPPLLPTVYVPGIVPGPTLVLVSPKEVPQLKPLFPQVATPTQAISFAELQKAFFGFYERTHSLGILGCKVNLATLNAGGPPQPPPATPPATSTASQTAASASSSPTSNRDGVTLPELLACMDVAGKATLSEAKAAVMLPHLNVALKEVRPLSLNSVAFRPLLIRCVCVCTSYRPRSTLHSASLHFWHKSATSLFPLKDGRR